MNDIINAMSPSRTDELAHLVLSSANWPVDASTSQYESPTPHLDELERALDIRLNPLTSISSRASSVRICTLPNGKQSPASKSGSTTNKDVWTWTPQPDNIDNSYSTRQVIDADVNATLEEMAPFSPEFYRHLGNLAREAFHPGSVKSLHNAHKQSTTTAPTQSAAEMHSTLHSLEQYSLPRMHDAVRLTRILLMLQEMHVDEDCTFLDRLLYYCEGNTGQSHEKSAQEADDGPIEVVGEDASKHKESGARIPILSSLFHHWGELPQLEHGLQQLSRRYTSLLPMNAAEYWEYDSGNTNTNATASIGDGGSTGGEWKPSSDTSFLGSRAMRIDSYRSRLEEELACHIHGDKSENKLNRNNPESGGLVRLLSLMYASCDATLRGKIRRWMGQRLRSHALGGGSVSYSRGLDDNGGMQSWGLGPSFLAFCPLVGMSSVGSGGAASRGFVSGSGPISLTQLGEGPGGMQQHNPLGMENTSACGIEGLLQVLLLIISGFQPNNNLPTTKKRDTPQRSTILQPAHENLLFEVLIPLHRPSGMVLWRDQTPLIGLYHESLVKCIGALINMDAALVGPVVGALLHPDIWPTEGSERANGGTAGSSRGAAAANTPKVVLLIHEVDTLICLIRLTKEDDMERCFSSFDSHTLPLAMKLCSCISSDNSRTSERALQLFKNGNFKLLVKRNLDQVGPHFLRALCRCSSGGSAWKVPWNPTVKKMTLLVLKELEGYYQEQGGDEAFDTACDETLGGYLNNQPTATTAKSTGAKETSSKRGTAVIGTRPNDVITDSSGNMTSLKSAMGSWRPPTQKSKLPKPSSQTGASAQQPPVTVTGVAPWALSGQSRLPSKTASNQPPLTITGVAPWSMSKTASSSASLPRSSKRPLPGIPLGRPLPPLDDGNVEVSIAEDVKETDEADLSLEGDALIVSSALKKVRAYMEKLKPPNEDGSSSDGISRWSKAQMLESPVLLPNLKFHDLVFGQELGTGAFSTVRYARQIVKDTTRSNWPEYAVKIVSTQKIEELGYEQSINREIAILRVMSHPGISRLISSFRFRDGAYLILEYASGGDLHTLLRKNGSLDHESTKFVIGSVAAALWSVHERGFVYADCKPENILIMETGHIKVTDFGGCRPVTDEAKALVKASSNNLIRQLRDGDWKPSSRDSSKDLADKNTVPSDQEPEDVRIEGTTAYLPPEVVIGSFPTAAADVWALGCVMFQCLSGRPPILEDNDELTAQKIVSFHLTSQSTDFFGEHDNSATFSHDEKALIERMLSRNPSDRPSVSEMANDEYFEGMDIFSLHIKPAHRLDIGSIAPLADAKWSRRQFSSIWAPQPHAYNINDVPTAAAAGNSSRVEPIIEGEEISVLFYSAQKAPLLAKIRE